MSGTICFWRADNIRPYMNAAAYGKAGGHRNPPLRLIIKVLILIDKNQNISYNITLDNTEDILNLFRMTPYAYRTSSVGRERIESLETIETDIEFITFVYKKV